MPYPSSWQPCNVNHGQGQICLCVETAISRWLDAPLSRALVRDLIRGMFCADKATLVIALGCSQCLFMVFVQRIAFAVFISIFSILCAILAVVDRQQAPKRIAAAIAQPPSNSPRKTPRKKAAPEPATSVGRSRYHVLLTVSLVVTFKWNHRLSGAMQGAGYNQPSRLTCMPCCESNAFA